MKARLLFPILLIASLAVTGLTGCQAATPSSSQVPSGALTAAVLPVNSNPIVNAGTAPGLTIVSAAVEDNVDPQTQAAIKDRLQVTLQNDSTAEVTKLEIYYVMTDVTTKQSEAYYRALTGVVLAPKSQTTVSFDSDTGAGHFPENSFSIYRSSQNQVDFTVEVSAPGLKPAHATATKGSGAGDAAD